MTHPPIIDAGPSLNFLSINKERLLISVLGKLSAPTVLERAAGGAHIPDKGEMRTIYERLRGLDDGLPPIEATRLLSSSCWADRAANNGR